MTSGVRPSHQLGGSTLETRGAFDGGVCCAGEKAGSRDEKRSAKKARISGRKDPNISRRLLMVSSPAGCREIAGGGATGTRHFS